MRDVVLSRRGVGREVAVQTILLRFWRLILVTGVLLCLNGICPGDAGANPLGVPDSEYDALVALYNTNDGANWVRHDNWLTANPTWYGVLVVAGHVIRVSLQSNNLSGVMSTQIGGLTYLQYLNLSRNALTGDIPIELGSLSSLQTLNLCYNRLTGQIPIQLGSLASLQSLDLSDNALSGQIPTQLGNLANLRSMSLVWNSLSGQIPIELGNLANLRTLDVSYNELTGQIPAQLGNPTNLRALNLSFNQLTGQIPTQLGNLANLESLDLNNNRLSGQIPTELGNMGNVLSLSLNNCRLTGQIPAQLGNLSNLTYLNLCNNQLSGAMPAELGNLTHLEALTVAFNRLTGQIPWQLGNLTGLLYLGLNGNRLTGQIPAQLGNLASVQQFFVSGNQLSGSIPSSLVNLTQLIAGSLSYNALSALGPTLISFLDSSFPGWQNTQTLSPGGVSATMVGAHSVQVSWTPILYTDDAGYYEIGIGTAREGPYTYDTANRTADKSASSLTLTGLPNESALYLVVRAVTRAHTYNQSDVTSVPSAEVDVNLFAPILLSPDNAVTEVGGGIVTAVFPDCFYIESSDRICGIRVVAAGQTVTAGKVDIAGTLRTNAAGERYIEASSVSYAGAGSVLPVALANKALGGADWSYDPGTGAGRKGIAGGVGLNNIGLLVRTWGLVTSPAGTGYFSVTDGNGVAVKCLLLSGAMPPAQGSHAAVTGIISCDNVGGQTWPLLRVRQQSDISVF